jgi:hypothetical protein
MAEKQNTHTLNKIQSVMVVTAMAALFTLWNVFATTDRRKDDCEVKLQSALASTGDDVVENRGLRSLLMDNCLIGTGGS